MAPDAAEDVEEEEDPSWSCWSSSWSTVDWRLLLKTAEFPGDNKEEDLADVESIDVVVDVGEGGLVDWSADGNGIL